MIGIPKDELRDLRLLSEIEKSSHLNQRVLSKKLGIALGLTNLCIKRLVKKGYIKVASVDNRRLKYIITPEGLAEKSRLTYEYFKATMDFIKRVRGDIVRIFQRLESQGCKKVVFYGSGEEAEIAYISLHQTNLTLVGVLDDDRVGTSLFGFPVQPLKELLSLDFDVVVIVSLDDPHSRLQALQEMNINNESIVLLGEG